MGLGVSLIVIAVGAVLTWAVNADVSGLNVTAVGVIKAPGGFEPPYEALQASA
jgi:uncharacterized membrane protein